jgi:hypothetical protein
MANNDRIKVVGYAQRVFYNDGIEYRNFSDDLVGNQQTEGDDGQTSLFTFGNFVTTTNFEGRATRFYSTAKYSKFYCLENLNLSLERANSLLDNNVNVTLNMDGSELCSFAYFGSATEFVRVSLEDIITNWPASLYMRPFRDTDIFTISGYTVIDYTYDTNFDISRFKVDTNFINNKFNINYQTNGTIANTFNEGNDLRNLMVNYASYVIFINNEEYPIINFTGSTNIKNDYIHFEVNGNPFNTGNSVSLLAEYHVKPKKELEEEFFNSLDEYQSNLLNRLTVPKYKSTYSYKSESDTGVFINRKKELVWPVSDGYNIDYDTTQYINFVSDLVEISDSKDLTSSDLISRFLVSESISDFDTVPRCDGGFEETSGEKINKTLRIYGREFDQIKKYIDGISFANVVTYNKKNNTPDQLVKYLGRVLGWELVSSVLDNDLISSYLNVGESTYSGQSRGLSPAEADVELWRRLILNSAWIWKSKGTRKAVEFFFKLIGAPDGLINFDEHVYVVKEPIDMDLFYAVLENNNLEDDLNLYNVDPDGYPKFFRDNSQMYFQKGGLWYRETAGPNATQYILQGNNPHVGPYDGGREYIYQLENIIPNFSAFTLTSTTITTGTTQLFTNYNGGVMNQYTGNTYVDVQNQDGVDLSDVVVLDTRIITDPCPTAELTDCGCDVPEDDESLIIDVVNNCETSLSPLTCEEKFDGYNFVDSLNLYTWSYIVFNQNDTVYPKSKNSHFVSQECCKQLVNGVPYYSENYNLLSSNETNNGTLIDWDLDNCGYVCCGQLSEEEALNAYKNSIGCGCRVTCQWILASTNDSGMYNDGNGNVYLKFIDPAGNFRVVSKTDSCFCPSRYTTPSVITDPYTGEVGYACRLNNSDAVNDNTINAINDALYQFFVDKATGVIGCYEDI